jgi:hypothetical protein
MLMGVAAIARLGYEFGRLLFGLGARGGVDLIMRQGEVQAWFKGDPVYGAIWTAVYPPASYAILWPLIGWLGPAKARWLYAAAAIGNGQITVFVLPFLLGALHLFCRGRCSFVKDLTGSVLVALALVKPSLAAPFLWVVLFVPGRLRPALLTACAYVGITVLAFSFQKTDPLSLIDGFLTTTTGILRGPAAVKYSHTPGATFSRKQTNRPRR